MLGIVNNVIYHSNMIVVLYSICEGPRIHILPVDNVRVPAIISYVLNSHHVILS